MQDATTSGRVSPRLSDAITLAGASAYMYLASFCYELGYCTFFGVPSSFIVPSLSTILVASVVISSVLLPSLFWLGFTLPLFRAAEKPSLRPYRVLIGLLAWSSASGVILSLIYGLSFRGLMIFVIAVLGIEASLFLPAVLFNRHLTIPQRLEENAEVQAEDPFDVTPLLAATRPRLTARRPLPAVYQVEKRAIGLLQALARSVRAVQCGTA